MYAGQTDSGVQEVEAAAAAGGGSSVGAAPGGADPALTRGAYVCCCCCTLLPVLLLPLGLIGALTASGFTGGAGEATVGTKVGLSEVDPLAVCNDGTESGYYFSPASETAHERKWLVWLQGGALCADEKGCTARMENTPDWMSSAAWPDSHEYSGVLEQSDPTFGGWNQAVVEYCTSDLYLGDREASAETFNWHFRGQRVVKAVLKSLQAKGLRSGDTLVLSGCSAGAMGATVLCDFVQGWLEPTVTDLQLACVLDSPLPVIDVEGLKQAQPGFGASVRGWLDLWGVRGLLHPGCTEGRSAADSWKCLYPEYVVAELSTPWFMSANRFDAFGAALEESGASMLNDQFDYLSPFNDPDMNAWGKAQQVVSDGLPTADQPDAAVFQAGCAMHCGMQAPLYGNVNAGDGTTMRDAIQSCKYLAQPVDSRSSVQT